MSQLLPLNARTCRPREQLEMASKLYPAAWSDIEEMRARRGTSTLADWPQWCYIPIAGAQAAVANDASIDVRLLALRYPERVLDATRLAGLAAWRITQGIYRFDPAVFDAVRTTPVSGNIPHDVLYRLPEWCVYIETPGLQFSDAPLHGVWAHLESDVHTGEPELRLLLDVENMALVPVALHLGAWSLDESIARALKQAEGAAPVSRPGTSLLGLEWYPAALRASLEPVVSMLLYICSQADEVGRDGHRPVRPTPKRTRRHGWRLFPANGPTTWDVGVRMGAALRRAYQAEQTGHEHEHGSPRPHIRRAHWHTILSGPRLQADGSPIPPDQRKSELRWMPPITVNVVGDPGGLPAVVRRVGSSEV